MLASDAALADRYAALCTSRAERKLEVSAAHLIFRNTDAAGLPRNESFPIVKITTEGRSRRRSGDDPRTVHRLRISSAAFLDFGQRKILRTHGDAVPALARVSLLPGTC